MKIKRSTEMLHPLLKKSVLTIQKDIIDAHNIPIRLFETGRIPERHQMLLNKGKTKDGVSMHLYNLENDPPLYATAIDYVVYNGKWSWNLRDSTILAWYVLFGNLVMDKCPELQWFGMKRKAINYCHFEIKRDMLILNRKEIPCVV